MKNKSKIYKFGLFQPHVFGMMGGEANPSGVALMTIMATMFICSLPFVRYNLTYYFSFQKCGHFSDAGDISRRFTTPTCSTGDTSSSCYSTPLSSGSGSVSSGSSGWWRSPTGSSTISSGTASPSSRQESFCPPK